VPVSSLNYFIRRCAADNNAPPERVDGWLLTRVPGDHVIVAPAVLEPEADGQRRASELPHPDDAGAMRRALPPSSAQWQQLLSPASNQGGSSSSTSGSLADKHGNHGTQSSSSSSSSSNGFSVQALQKYAVPALVASARGGLGSRSGSRSGTWGLPWVRVPAIKGGASGLPLVGAH
jgi:hypothetical protein